MKTITKKQEMTMVGLASACLVVLVLSALSGCEPPTSERRDEPDTAKSYVRAIVSAPGMNNVVWEAHNNDTLDDGKVGRIQPDRTLVIRSGLAAVSNVEGQYYPQTNQRPLISIGFIFDRVHSMNKTPRLRFDNTIDSMRKWYGEKITLIYEYSELPVTNGSVSIITWRQYGLVEENTSPVTTSRGTGDWGLSALPFLQTSVEAWVDPPNSDRRYRSVIDSSFLVIDKLDLAKHRAWGRFAFRVTGSINQEVIDVRDGVFENVGIAFR
jgi:hypothetical protein